MQLIRSQQGQHFDTIRLYMAVDRDAQAEIMKEYYDAEEKETLSQNDDSL